MKAAALLQMCAYSEQVERLQGVAPQQMHVITGDGESHAFKLTDYSAYYRALKARFAELVDRAHDTPGITTYPDPVDHCGICRWTDVCKDRRRADDHLSLVSGMRRDQTRKLTDVGIATRGALATLPAGTTVSGMADMSVERLRHQAELQVRNDGLPPYLYELLPPEPPDPLDPEATWPQRGWAALPEPSPGDLFFDMEGDPYALDDEHGSGLEYLFGVIELDADGAPHYRAFWAHSRAEEKTAFEDFVDYVMKRRAEHPDLHVYHYAPYEPSAMKRLMGEHHTRESEIDELLRGEVFVDLYAVVRSAVRIGSESYSLKQVEKLYMDRPAGEVMDGGGSIVAYEEYLEHGEQATLDEIEAYNEDDCALDARPARLVGSAPRRGRSAVRRDPAARGARRRRARGGQRTRAGRRDPVGAAAGRRTRRRAAPALAARADARLAPPRSEARLLDVLRAPEDERRRAARRPRVHQRARVRG